MSRAKHAAVLGVAVALGGGGVYTSNNYMSTQLEQEKSRLESEYTQEEISVVVPSRPIEPGEVITEDHLVLRSIPVDFVHTDTVSYENYVNAIGQRSAHLLEPGKPILWAQLELGSLGTFSSLLEEGHRALTVSVDEINSISGFLQPDDRVDLFLTFTENKNRKTRLLMSQVRVIATGTLTRPLPDGAGVRDYGTLTVDVTPKQAERLIHAQSSGSLTATLKNADDTMVALDSAPTTMDNLFGDKPKKKPKPKPKPKPKIVEKVGIEYIFGGVGKGEGK